MKTPSTALEWSGTLQDDLSVHSSHRLMNTSNLYHPWGDQIANAVTSIIFTVWITVTNVFLVFLLITNVKLLNSRQNIVLLHNTVTDLTVGVFYCPLAADFYIRGSWDHGCGTFFVWFSFAFPLAFLTTHSILLLLVMRVLPFCCKKIRAKLTKCLINVIFVVGFVILWLYMSGIGAYLSESRHPHVHIWVSPETSCHALVVSNNAVTIDLLVYFLPASLCVILLVVVAVREKTAMSVPSAQLQLETDTEQCTVMPLPALTTVVLLTSFMPLPSFLITSIMVKGICTTFTCLSWLRMLGVIADWLMFAKSGIVPLVLFLAPDFRLALMGALHNFRRVPTSDARELVTNMEDEEDDAPFSTM